MIRLPALGGFIRACLAHHSGALAAKTRRRPHHFTLNTDGVVVVEPTVPPSRGKQKWCGYRAGSRGMNPRVLPRRGALPSKPPVVQGTGTRWKPVNFPPRLPRTGRAANNCLYQFMINRLFPTGLPRSSSNLNDANGIGRMRNIPS